MNTTTFAEFLRERASQMPSGTAEGRRAMIEDWRRSVSGLLARLQDWLRAADTDQLLQTSEGSKEIRETGLGRYSVPTLEIFGLGRSIDIEPKLRLTSGPISFKASVGLASGLVEITNGYGRTPLYRVEKDGVENWFEFDRHGETRPLTEELFARLLMAYFA